MGFFNENMTWFFFLFFGQLLSGLSLTVGFLKNFGIVIVFSWLFQQLKVDKARNTPIFLLVRDVLLLKGKVFLAYFIQYGRQT